MRARGRRVPRLGTVWRRAAGDASGGAPFAEDATAGNGTRGPGKSLPEPLAGYETREGPSPPHYLPQPHSLYPHTWHFMHPSS